MSAHRVALRPTSGTHLLDLYNPFSSGVGRLRHHLNVRVGHHSGRFGLANHPVYIATTTSVLHDLCISATPVHNRVRSVRPRRVRLTVGRTQMLRRDTRDIPRCNGTIGVGAGHNMVGPHAPGRTRCVTGVLSRSVAFNINPTNANGACLTITTTISTLRHRRVHHVLLAHPTIRTNRGLNFLPNSLDRGMSPCLHPLCSTLFRVLNFRGIRGLVRHGIVRITPLTCVHNHALGSTFVVLSRDRGAAVRRVGVFLAHVNFGSGTIVANSIARVSLPHGAGSNLHRTVRILTSIRRVDFGFFRDRSIIHRPIITHVIGTCRT